MKLQITVDAFTPPKRMNCSSSHTSEAIAQFAIGDFQLFPIESLPLLYIEIVFESFVWAEGIAALAVSSKLGELFDTKNDFLPGDELDA